MKGVILSINPHAQIVDLSHAVPPRDIRAGAIVLAETARWFPPGTIHVAVVDPGRRQQAADRLRPNRHAAVCRAG